MKKITVLNYKHDLSYISPRNKTKYVALIFIYGELRKDDKRIVMIKMMFFYLKPESIV